MDQWDRSLAGARHTAEAVREKCEQELLLERSRRGAGLASGLPLLEETAALRRTVNASLMSQMEYFTRCMQAWSGATPTTL